MRTRGQDEGFTIIELLLSIVLLAAVIAVVGGAFSATFRTTDEAQARLSGSHDAEILSAYFVRDVQSALSVSTTSGSCGSGALVLSLKWVDASGDHGEASYRRTNANPQQLVRSLCVGSQPQVDVVVVDGLVQAPVVACLPLACGVARRVEMTVKTSSNYTFKIAGARRST